MFAEERMTEVSVNVCVAVRVRPLLPSERLHSHQVCVKKVAHSKNQLLVGKDRSFTFDHVLWWNTKQQDVYKTTVSPLVDSCFQGYNATVFAYGQTGSGKTYTIGGSNPANITKEDQGIIPRAIDDIFSHVKAAAKGVEHVIKVSYVEIYKEEIRDLLEVDVQKCKDVHIREDQNGNTVIVGAKEEICTVADEVLSLLQKGSALRHTGATQMNELSSRSHAIFTIQIIQTWPATPRPKNSNNNNSQSITNMEESIESVDMENLQNVMSAKFHFVDLAGSERANRTGNTGERFKESVQINTGLLALGNVISALGDPKKKKTAHIPYRDSKITRVLKDSLGGNARTVMITCISPSSTSFDESLNALKYANRAKNITNKPVVNRDPQQVLMEEMQDEIEALKQQLQERPTTREIALQKQEILEQELKDLQSHCDQYKRFIEEATKHFKTVCAAKHVTKGQSNVIKRWIETVTKTSLALSKQDIFASMTSSLSHEDKIHQELEECKKNLASDEIVFAEKDAQLEELRKVMGDMQSEIRERDESLQTYDEITVQQEEKLIEQKVAIEQLQEEIMYLRDEFQNQPVSSRRQHPLGVVSVGRAQSVPHPAHGLGFSVESRLMSEEAKRAHSSPPLLSAEKIMAGFRARNHIIADRIEEEDEVDHRLFIADGNDLENDTQEAAGDRSDRSVNSRKKENYYFQQEQWRIPSARNQTEPKEIKDEVSKELNVLRGSTVLSVRRLKDSELRAQNANNKIRELSINIRMKEELIKDLVRTGNDAEAVNREYNTRIQTLEKEVQLAKLELINAHKVLQNPPEYNVDEKELHKLKADYEHKLKDAKSKVQLLQKKQRETEKMSSIPSVNKKKIQELEIGIAAMRQMQEDLQKKFKGEQDKKRKLESELSRDQARIKELENKTKNQEKILKRKTEEVAAIQKKMRSVAQNGFRDDSENVDEQRKWLDEEVEKALKQQKLLKQLEEALRAREAAVIRREETLKRKNVLETKKMRSSRVISTETLQLASQIALVDQQLSARTQQLQDSVNQTERSRHGSTASKKQQLKKAIERLQSEKIHLEDKRKILEEKLQDGDILNLQEERELIELDEAVEALSAAIEWQDDAILRCSSSTDLRESRIKLSKERASGLQKYFSNLSSTEAGILLSKCFERVIELREYELTIEGRLTEMEARLNDRDKAVVEAEMALNRVIVENDRHIMEMQKQHEQRSQQLLKQLAENESTARPSSSSYISTRTMTEFENKINALGKDIAYYKSSNRELKKKLREVLLESGAVDNLPLSARSNRSNSESEPGKSTSARKEKFDGPAIDSGAIMTSHSAASSTVGHRTKHTVPLSQSSNNLVNQDINSKSQRYASPQKQSKKSLTRQSSGDAVKESLTKQQSSDVVNFAASKVGSNALPPAGSSLYRSRRDSHPSLLHPCITTNSVEYSEYKALSRGGSGGRHIGNPVIENSHPPTNPQQHNLITASLTLIEPLSSSPSKKYPSMHPVATYVEETVEPKSTKLDQSITPVRISKKDLKRLPKNEVTQRKSNITDHSLGSAKTGMIGPGMSSQNAIMQDSLEGLKNPW